MSISTWVYDPYKLAGQHRTLEGRVAVDAMVRANKLTAKEQGEFTYQVAFALDVDNVCIISGELHGEVHIMLPNAACSYLHMLWNVLLRLARCKVTLQLKN